MTEHPKHALPIGHEIAGYQIARVIGQGGFGIVYEATNPVTGERVAVKEFYPSAVATRQGGTIVVNSDREMEVFERVLDRFQQTAAVQFKFRHPNILRVFNYLRGKNTGYMITEYIDGGSLRGFLEKYGGHFPSAEMFQATMEQVLGAIGYVHRLGHIHRDLAPDNVMIDAFAKPTVIDFGALKRDLRGSNAYSSIVVMREDYSPPEQQDPSLQQGFYTDVFALAGTMYCTLAGSPPMRATTRAFNRPDPYVPIAQASKVFCPPEVYAAIDAALRLSAHERPQSVDEFASLLRWNPYYGDGAAPSQGRAAAAPTRAGMDAAPTRARASVQAGVDTVAVGRESHAALFSPPPPPSPPLRRSGGLRNVVAGLVIAVVLAGAAALAWFNPYGWRLGGSNACSPQALEMASGRGEDGLREFLSTCTKGAQADEGRRRLDAQIDIREATLVNDAGFDVGKLRAYLQTCIRCSSRPEAETRLSLIRDEEMTYRAATGSIERLELYMKQCRACQYRDEAMRNTESLRRAQEAESLRKAQEARAKRDEDDYRAAMGSIERLENYARTCDLCRYRDEALREVATLRDAQRKQPPPPREPQGWALDVVNDTGSRITMINAGVAGRNQWSDDLLRGNAIEPRANFEIDVNDNSKECRFDLRAILENGRTVVFRGINLCKQAQWIVR